MHVNHRRQKKLRWNEITKAKKEIEKNRSANIQIEWEQQRRTHVLSKYLNPIEHRMIGDFVEPIPYG